jgi:hypothetical protein
MISILFSISVSAIEASEKGYRPERVSAWVHGLPIAASQRGTTTLVVRLVRLGGGMQYRPAHWLRQSDLHSIYMVEVVVARVGVHASVERRMRTTGYTPAARWDEQAEER